jgi:hypothetical protein
MAREAQLSRQPLCEECIKARIDWPAAANVVNHRIPPKGDTKLFWDPANHQSVCKPHHDGPIQRTERIGFSPAVDDAGWPVDPMHRSNRAEPSWPVRQAKHHPR